MPLYDYVNLGRQRIGNVNESTIVLMGFHSPHQNQIN